jgi:hypothetical protein
MKPHAVCQTRPAAFPSARPAWLMMLHAEAGGAQLSALMPFSRKAAARMPTRSCGRHPCACAA